MSNYGILGIMYELTVCVFIVYGVKICNVIFYEFLLCEISPLALLGRDDRTFLYHFDWNEAEWRNLYICYSETSPFRSR